MIGDEYRYLTFLYYDLVDSTPLSQRLDEEDWRLCLSEFLRICNQVIEEQGGRIHGDRGDGSLAYFGFPVTQRISAVQAVRAGLTLVNDSSQLFAELNNKLSAQGADPIHLRIGIHSGKIVMGEIGGRRKATGFPLALAERLHACAEPNSVILSNATRELIGERFEVESIGEQLLKGVEHPVTCFRALAENDDRQALRSPLVGRTRELHVLQEKWKHNRKGSPEVILITGDTGIGKTRLVSEFRHSIGEENLIRLTWRCDAELSDNAFHPVIEAMKRYVLNPEHISQADRSARIRDLLPEDLRDETVISAIHHMLGLPTKQAHTTEYPSAEARRESNLKALVDVLVSVTRQRPMLLIVEDMQWIDASTQECLEKLAAREDCGSLMLLITQRTDESNRPSYPIATFVVPLERLSADSARSLIVAQPGGNHLSQESFSEILKRSDGVPLFIEESAHLEIDRRQNSAKSERAPGDLVDIDTHLPPRLIDLLTARLDSLGDARETAGLAASIGREFSLRLLESVSSLQSHTVRQHVRNLVDTGLVLRQHLNGDTIGRFKHALVRDSAYSMIIKSRRRAYHRKIAEILESSNIDGTSVRSDKLALHHHAAANYDKAFLLWIDAGVQARRRSEQLEAISHFRKAESLIQLLPADVFQQRCQQTLILHLASVRCHVALDGYSSSEAYRHAKLAEQLALKYGSEMEIVNARFSMVSWLFVSGDIEKARQLAVDCLQRSEKALREFPPTGLQKTRESIELNVARGNWACGNIDFHLALFDHAIKRIDRCLVLCRQLTSMVKTMDQDPLVMCLCYRSWYEWESGDADCALQTVEEAVSMARQNARAFSIALSLSFKAAIHLFRGEFEDTVKCASESISISERSRYASWHAWALVLRGRAQCQLESDRSKGIEQIVEGIRLWDLSGTIITRPFMLAQLAESCALDGQMDKALLATEEALGIVERHGDRYYEAAIICTQAKIMTARAGSNTHAQNTAKLFRQSIAIAESHQQFGSALNAEIELYKLTARPTNSPGCQARLEKALSRMKSGQDTRSPMSARHLLNQHLPDSLDLPLPANH